MAQMMQLRAWLLDSEPEVWRHLLVDPRLTLEQLHAVLQGAFGWTNSHLHQFHEKDGTRYAIPSPFDDHLGPGTHPVIDERRVCLREVFPRASKKIAYEYDFGDSWVHAVQFEKMTDAESFDYPSETFVREGKGCFSGKVRAAICVAGSRNGPPEDCGGLHGFQHILELKLKPPKPADKNADEDLERLEWVGDWDPEHFDLAEINQRLGRVRVKKAFKN